MNEVFVCLDCHYLFTRPRELIERHGLEYGYERIVGCPICMGGYTSAYRCIECGEYIDSSYIRIGNFRYHNDCVQQFELGEEI